MPNSIINTHFRFFDETIQIHNIILKTKQITIVFVQWNSWTSCDGIKYHMIITNVGNQYSSRGIDVSALLSTGMLQKFIM